MYGGDVRIINDIIKKARAINFVRKKSTTKTMPKIGKKQKHNKYKKKPNNKCNDFPKVTKEKSK